MLLVAGMRVLNELGVSIAPIVGAAGAPRAGRGGSVDAGSGGGARRGGRQGETAAYNSRFNRTSSEQGEMAERLKAHAWNACIGE
jgi:hypothetical protein